MLLYFNAVDGNYNSHETAQVSLKHTEVFRWWQIVAAVLLSWSAALCKEIGITTLGVMMLYDLLLVPGCPERKCWQRSSVAPSTSKKRDGDAEEARGQSLPRPRTFWQAFFLKKSQER
jgi:hypothetical protein